MVAMTCDVIKGWNAGGDMDRRFPVLRDACRNARRCHQGSLDKSSTLPLRNVIFNRKNYWLVCAEVLPPGVLYVCLPVCSAYWLLTSKRKGVGKNNIGANFLHGRGTQKVKGQADGHTLCRHWSDIQCSFVTIILTMFVMITIICICKCRPTELFDIIQRDTETTYKCGVWNCALLGSFYSSWASMYFRHTA